MKTSNLKSFSIYGLFGTQDVHIPFDEDIKILIGENGLGKTQILGMLYCLLNGNIEKLSDYSFDRLELVFVDNGKLGISKKELFIFLQNKPQIRWDQVFPLKKNIEKNFIYRSRIIPLVIESGNNEEEEIDNNEEEEIDNNVSTFFNKLKEKLKNLSILYFPTYRRVEEDLKNLGYDEDQFPKGKNELIQFGMEDVKKRFTDIENSIDALLKEGFSKISGEILSQLVSGFEKADRSFLEKIDENDIEIILSRVGKELSDGEKNKIRNIITYQKIENPSLFYFLRKLIEIYEKQKPLDDFVKVYRDVCNKYLVNKKVFYDESAIKIYIKLDATGEEIELSKLSSGEKQIISILSKIYLSAKEERFIILFDEPELSLSMTWQKQLLPDIIDSKKCDFLLAVTHSPFIFDNKLDRYAVGLNEYIKPVEKVNV